MEGRRVFEEVFGLISQHKLLLAAALILAVPNTVVEVWQEEHLFWMIVVLLATQPLQFGGLYMALRAWRNEPLAISQLLYCYSGRRLGRSLVYALAYTGAAFLAGLVIGLGILVSALFGILAPFGMAACVFFGLAVLGILMYPMLLAYLDNDSLTVGEAYSQGRKLTMGRFKPLLGIAWGIFWRVAAVSFLPGLIMFASSAPDSPVRVVMLYLISFVGFYAVAIIAGVWQTLLEEAASLEAKQAAVGDAETL